MPHSQQAQNEGWLYIWEIIRIIFKRQNTTAFYLILDAKASGGRIARGGHKKNQVSDDMKSLHPGHHQDDMF